MTKNQKTGNLEDKTRSLENLKYRKQEDYKTGKLKDWKGDKKSRKLEDQKSDRPGSRFSQDELL